MHFDQPSRLFRCEKHLHTHTHARTHARTHAHTHACTRTHARTHTHAHARTHLHTHTHIRARARAHVTMPYYHSSQTHSEVERACKTKAVNFTVPTSYRYSLPIRVRASPSMRCVYPLTLSSPTLASLHNAHRLVHFTSARMPMRARSSKSIRITWHRPTAMT